MDVFDGATLRRIYNECAVGSAEPELALIGGAGLNELLDVSTYDPFAIYEVSRDGIRRYDPGDDEE